MTPLVRQVKEGYLWPTENPTFSDVTAGKGVSQRVRISRPADRTGSGEQLVLESDILENRGKCDWRPIEMLLRCFCIRLRGTNHMHVKSMAEFENLPKKINAIIGAENMSYAPHFMPNYKAAFAYASRESADAAAQTLKKGREKDNDDDNDDEDGQLSDIEEVQVNVAD